MNNNYPVQERYEDEIDLVDLICVLIKGRKIIVSITIIFLSIGLIFAIYQKQKSYRATAFITFSNTSSINLDMMTSTAVLERVYQNFPILNQKGFTIESVRRGFDVEGIVPKYIQARISQALKDNEIYAFTPSNYKLTLQLTGDNRLDRQILNNLIMEYREYYDYRYTRDDLIKTFGNVEDNLFLSEVDADVLAEISIDFDKYDYLEILDIINTNTSALIESISSKKSLNFNSKKYQIGFSELLNEINTLKSIENNMYGSLIKNNNITKENAIILEGYRNELRNLRLHKSKLESEENALRNMLEEFKPEQRQIFINNRGEVISQNDNDNYYSRMIENMTNTSIKIRVINEDIDFILNKIEEISSKNNNGINNHLIKRVDELGLIIISRLNEIIKKSNDMTIEFREISFSNNIRKITPVETLWESKIKLISAISLVLGLFLGVFIVFILEFKKNLKIK